MTNKLVIILAISFFVMAVQITENLQQAVICLIFGASLIGIAYIATKSDKNKKEFSERNIFMTRANRVIYATIAITIIISFISIPAYYMLFDPMWTNPFTLTLPWMAYFIGAGIFTFIFVSLKID